MAVKNHIIKIRIDEEMNNLLNEAVEKIGFKKTELIRYLLNRALQQLKSDSIQAHGFDKLEFTLRH